MEQVVVVADVKYDLSHLTPLEFKVSIPGPNPKIVIPVDVHVRFSKHCYTSKYDKDGTGFEIFDGREVRFFSLERYEFSKNLPEIVRAIGTSEKCFFTPHRNYFVARTECGKEYRVFFSVKKRGAKKISVSVESAYAPDNPQRKKGSIKGFLLLAKTLRNEKIKKAL